jgi:hypothetical protein
VGRVRRVADGNVFIYLCLGAPDENTNPILKNVLSAMFNGHVAFVRGRLCDGEPVTLPTLPVGGALSWRFDGGVGTLDVRVDGGGEWLRVFDGVKSKEVHCGFFLDGTAEIKLEAFGRLDAGVCACV